MLCKHEVVGSIPSASTIGGGGPANSAGSSDQTPSPCGTFETTANLSPVAVIVGDPAREVSSPGTERDLGHREEGL